MIKNIVATVLIFFIGGLGVYGAGTVANPTVGAPLPIEENSPCPATSCASGQCHGYDSVPTPDGIHEMTCPEESCSSVECHAWDTLTTRYYSPSDASLNLWILAPVVLVVGLVLLVKKL